MAVPYKLLRTTGSLANKSTLKVVLDEYGTVGIATLAKLIDKATTMTKADLVGALEALKTEMVNQLMDGNRVHLPGLGYFSLSVKGELYEDPRSHKFRLRNAYVRTVNFRPDKQLLTELSYARFENRTYSSETCTMPTDEEIAAALAHLFAESPLILVSDLQSALHISRPMAYRLSRRLESDGKLRNVGSRYRKMFVKGEKG